MYMVFCLGIGLWAIYGVFRMDWFIIIANIAGFIQGATILALKFKYKKNEKKQIQPWPATLSTTVIMELIHRK